MPFVTRSVVMGARSVEPKQNRGFAMTLGWGDCQPSPGDSVQDWLKDHLKTLTSVDQAVSRLYWAASLRRARKPPPRGAK